MCISDNYSRIEDCEIDLIKLISSDLHIPTIIVITKSYYESEFSKEIKKLCHDAKMVISVNSKEVKLKEGFTIEVRNLDKLIDYSKKIILNDNLECEPLKDSFRNRETEISSENPQNERCYNSNNDISNNIESKLKNEKYYKSTNDIINNIDNNSKDEKYNKSFNDISNNKDNEFQKNEEINECTKFVNDYTRVIAALLAINRLENSNIHINRTKLKIEVEINIIERIANIFGVEIKENIRKIKELIFEYYDINNMNNNEIENRNTIKKTLIPGIELKDREFEILLKFYRCIKVIEHIIGELSKNGEDITYENIINLISIEKILNVNYNNLNNLIFKMCKIKIGKKNEVYKYEEDKINTKIKQGIKIVDSSVIARATLIHIKYYDKLLESIRNSMINSIFEIFNINNKDFHIENNELKSNICPELEKYKERDIFIDIPILILDEKEKEDIENLRNIGINYIEECTRIYKENNYNKNKKWKLIKKN